MQEEKIRTFIAIELEPKIQEELARLQERFKAVAPEVKWVAPRNIHLTLKFLGNVTASQVEEVKKILTEVSAKFKGFELTLRGIGAFPKPEYPKVVWAGVDEEKERLVQIAELLEKSLERVGFPREARAFSPHLTLGRIKFLKDRRGFASLINSLDFKAQNRVQVGRITLMKSTLTPKGPIYTPLFQAKLTQGLSPNKPSC